MSKTYDEIKSAKQFRHGSRISAGLRIAGQISGNEDLVVEGNVEGPVQLAEGTLTVGEKGTVRGDVVVREAIIHGTVTGNVQAHDRVEIKASGSVIGDLTTSRDHHWRWRALQGIDRDWSKMTLRWPRAKGQRIQRLRVSKFPNYLIAAGHLGECSSPT
jgi:hypothetical protein